MFDEFGFNPGARAHFPGNQPGCMQAHTAHSGRAQNHGNEQWPSRIHEITCARGIRSTGKVTSACYLWLQPHHMARRIKSYMETMFSHAGSVFSATFKEERNQIAVTGGPMKGKVALVTGANGGLGTYVTQALLDAGATVIGLSRKIEQSEFDSTNFTALPAEISTAD
jgi:3-oxoacyl-ACP reductase-like protein